MDILPSALRVCPGTLKSQAFATLGIPKDSKRDHYKEIYGEPSV